MKTTILGLRLRQCLVATVRTMGRLGMAVVASVFLLAGLPLAEADEAAGGSVLAACATIIGAAGLAMADPLSVRATMVPKE